MLIKQTLKYVFNRYLNDAFIGILIGIMERMAVYGKEDSCCR